MKSNIGVMVGLALLVLAGIGNAQDEAKKVVNLGSGKIGDSVSFDLPGGEKLVMKYCPGGKFTMGSPVGEKDRKDNEAQVEVTLSSHYWMAKTECTQAQWVLLMGNNPSRFQNPTDTSRPVEMVSWNDAQKWVSKLNQRVKPPAGWKWSLPSEAQWERACRAGTTTAYSFGDDSGKASAYAWCSGNSSRTTHPVGQKKLNAWGLYDMHGNVWEWCQDRFDPKLPGGTDPLTVGSYRSDRVLRGGNWNYDASHARGAYRYDGSIPGFTYGNNGFRVVLAPGQP